MHEWALAEAVVATVDKVYRENGCRPVKAVNLMVGEIQAIALESFNQGLEAILADQPFETEIFHLHIEKAAFRCNRCRKEWLLDDHQDCGEEEREAIHFLPEAAHVYLRCPFCKSPDFELTKGRGLSIKNIILESEDD